MNISHLLKLAKMCVFWSKFHLQIVCGAKSMKVSIGLIQECSEHWFIVEKLTDSCIFTTVVTETKGRDVDVMPQLPSSRAENNPWPEWPKVLKTDRKSVVEGKSVKISVHLGGRRINNKYISSCSKQP